MGRTRDKGTTLWDVFPSNDPSYEKWNNKYDINGDDRKSEKLKRTIRDNFHNINFLGRIFTDVHKRDKTRLSYKILNVFGYVDLKVKVRLPEKPNIYYVDVNWYKTGDYYIDPVEIWWSDYGKNVLKWWKGTCDVQHSSITNDNILNSIKKQYSDNPEVELDTSKESGDEIGEFKLKENDNTE